MELSREDIHDASGASLRRTESPAVLPNAGRALLQLHSRLHALSRRLLSPAAPASPSPTSSEHNFRPNYRPDVDGLRALAILPVVGFHALPDWVPGGFVGVDVFFVISGFLISTIIFRSLVKRDFSFFEFYVHRVRRILPALILVLTSCLLLGWYALLGSEFTSLGDHTAGGLGFVQNFVLWREAGYFDSASELKPLLHLWSLAIEEQFYLIFPLIMWLTWRLGLKLMIPVAIMLLASFAANLYAMQHDAVGAFFSPQTRFWELMAGAVLAWFALPEPANGDMRLDGSDAAPTKRAAKRGLHSTLSLVGLSLVLIAVFRLDRATPYPGTWALLPVTGAVLLILSGSNAWVNRLVLSNRLAVFVGRISYPLYLWHWPLLSFLMIFNSGSPSLYQRILVISLSFFLAWLTFRFVEQPARRSRRNQTVIAGNLVVGAVVLAVVGLSSEHFARSYDEPTRKIIEAFKPGNYPGPAGGHKDARYNFVSYGHNAENRILFVGDSHAFQYENAIATLIQKQISINAAGVPEIMFTIEGRDSYPPSLPPQVLDDQSIGTVVFSYFWAYRYRSSKVSLTARCCGSGLMGVSDMTPPPYTEAQKDELDASLEATVKSLSNAGKKVYLILDNPFGEELSPRFMVKRSFFHGVEIVIAPLSRKEAIQRAEPIRSRLLRIARETGAGVIDPVAWLCGDTCPVLSADGTPNYRDYDHLSLDTLLHRVHYFDALLRPRSTQ
jgi:peptidoglycan/LPS O-acetylase OafA/YrhL